MGSGVESIVAWLLSATVGPLIGRIVPPQREHHRKWITHVFLCTEALEWEENEVWAEC